MKLSFSTLPCEGWSVEQLIESCKKYGFTGIELKEDARYVVTIDSTEEELRRAAEKFRKAGIIVTNIGTRVIFNGVESNGAERLAELKRNIELAQALDAKGVRVMLGNYLRFKDAGEQPIKRQQIVRYLREGCDYASERGVEVWIETHNEFSTGQVLRQLLNEIDRDNCHIIYDIIHPFEFGEAPEETVRLFGRNCAHIHMKDGVPFEDPRIHEWKYTLIGEGALPLRSIVETLEANGYDGYYSLEWEPKWRPELQQLNLDVNDVLASYSSIMKSMIEVQES
ncbi:sugar phosphate isomerase/epimerase family protein [Paenibacillus glycanilyticus]|uniref:sugar phosphate isomerase/epimerase family protein n=1 Tax=Paenibacillus glycanilyticus TaxID=126569 RepID=UPI000FDBE229|nr:sugar phosphate isomerase/epimerase family protein [Paenibacillus glycanilyticus]